VDMKAMGEGEKASASKANAEAGNEIEEAK
jgi:hypothetical protein